MVMVEDDPENLAGGVRQRMGITKVHFVMAHDQGFLDTVLPPAAY